MAMTVPIGVLCFPAGAFSKNECSCSDRVLNLAPIVHFDAFVNISSLKILSINLKYSTSIFNFVS